MKNTIDFLKGVYKGLSDKQDIDSKFIITSNKETINKFIEDCTFGGKNISDAIGTVFDKNKTIDFNDEYFKFSKVFLSGYGHFVFKEDNNIKGILIEEDE